MMRRSQPAVILSRGDDEGSRGFTSEDADLTSQQCFIARSFAVFAAQDDPLGIKL